MSSGWRGGDRLRDRLRDLLLPTSWMIQGGTLEGTGEADGETCRGGVGVYTRRLVGGEGDRDEELGTDGGVTLPGSKLLHGKLAETGNKDACETGLRDIPIMGGGGPK